VNAENSNTNYPEVQSGAAELRDEMLPYRGRTPDDDPSPEQIAIYRRMPGARRLKLAERMFWEARRLKTAGVRHQNPEWQEQQVIAEVNRIFLHVRD
jgi:hypothetical protein